MRSCPTSAGVRRQHLAAWPGAALVLTVTVALAAPGLAGAADATPAGSGPASRGADPGASRGPALPLWEAGLAAGGAWLPDYPGAAGHRTRGLVVPYVVYRGPVVRVDEGGVSGRLFDSRHWRLELTASGAFNARDNPDRAGMPPLDWLFGIGPQLVYRGWQAEGGPSVHLKLRAIASTDFKTVDGRGFSFDPELRWRLPRVAGTPATLSLSVQPSWATRSLQRTFYEVTPAQATASRPAHAARGGYLGTDFGATLSIPMGPGLRGFVAASLASHHGAANVDSPLLRERATLGLGVGLVWTPWRSQRLAEP